MTPSAETALSAEERRSRVMETLMRVGSVQVDELAERFDVSRMTIHRDLDTLAKQGLLRKVRGGASAQRSVLFESNYHFRRTQALESKRQLARAALQRVEPGMAVILDASTTCAEVAEVLPEAAPLTVITNAHAILERLRQENGIDLICVGGTYSETFDAFLGVVTENALHSLRADVLFLSTSAVYGLTGYHQDEQVIRANRAMMEAADRRILLVDHTKFGKSALNRFADLTEFDEVLTDRQLDGGVRDELRDAEVPLQLV
ncbi:DeoR/GlpR family DNA-binding transcription regulator [Arhodomonas sp. AD133]|uniref:DeoR/GlpR family DNA-binding transcription regulator n=1 Tax=Arhodomonas sp. AD133 TaxID=3415009 RepID=UPI003EBBCEB0